MQLQCGRNVLGGHNIHNKNYHISPEASLGWIVECRARERELEAWRGAEGMGHEKDNSPKSPCFVVRKVWEV